MTISNYTKKKAGWPTGPPGRTSISIGGFRFKGNMWAVCTLFGVLVAGLVVLTSWMTAEQVLALLALFA